MSLVKPRGERPLRFLLEVTGEQTFERFAVTRFVACHFVHGVVDCVKSFFLGALCEVEFAFGGAVFGFHSLFEVDLGGRRHDFAEEFREFCRVFCLFECRLSQYRPISG